VVPRNIEKRLAIFGHFDVLELRDHSARTGIKGECPTVDCFRDFCRERRLRERNHGTDGN
jgi:hypothetical protein